MLPSNTTLRELIRFVKDTSNPRTPFLLPETDNVADVVEFLESNDVSVYALKKLATNSALKTLCFCKMWEIVRQADPGFVSLLELSGAEDLALQTAARLHPAGPVELLKYCPSDAAPEVLALVDLWKAASSSASPSDLIKSIAGATEDPRVLSALAARSSLLSVVCEKLLKSPYRTVHSALANNGAVPGHILEHIGFLDVPRVAYMVLHHPNVTSKLVRQIHESYSAEHSAFATAVARSVVCPPDLLDEFAKNSAATYKWDVAHNPNTRLSTLEYLFNEGNGSVCDLIADNPNASWQLRLRCEAKARGVEVDELIDAIES